MVSWYAVACKRYSLLFVSRTDLLTPGLLPTLLDVHRIVLKELKVKTNTVGWRLQNSLIQVAGATPIRKSIDNLLTPSDIGNTNVFDNYRGAFDVGLAGECVCVFIRGTHTDTHQTVVFFCCRRTRKLNMVGTHSQPTPGHTNKSNHSRQTTNYGSTE